MERRLAATADTGASGNLVVEDAVDAGCGPALSDGQTSDLTTTISMKVGGTGYFVHIKP